jgi:hypothetical protein
LLNRTISEPEGSSDYLGLLVEIMKNNITFIVQWIKALLTDEVTDQALF